MVKMKVYILILLSLGTINAFNFNNQKINLQVKLAEGLEIVKSEDDDGRMTLVLKKKEPPTPEPQVKLETLMEEMMKNPMLPVTPARHRPITIAIKETEVEGTEAKLQEVEKLVEIDRTLQLASKNEDATNTRSDSSFEINPVAMAVNHVGPKIPSIFSITRTMMKTICTHYESLTYAQRVKTYRNFKAMEKICDERNWNDYAMASQFNSIAGLIQEQIPKVGFSI